MKAIFENFDWVLIPAEKKNIPLLIFAKFLQLNSKNSTKLFSYNHPLFKSGNGKSTLIDKLLTRIYFKLLDRVIFYTENSRIEALEKNLLDPKKAFWANNAIDTSEVNQHYSFAPSPTDDLRIVFIGRLIPSKNISVLLDYYNSLKRSLGAEGKSLKIDIIGDGPDSKFVKNAQSKDKDILWHGSLVDEHKIAPIMKRGSIVFLPGLSGLAINHAFSYGRPFVTINSAGHGPEITYLKEGVNGFILKGEKNIDINMLFQLLSNPLDLNQMSQNAYMTGINLSVENWVSQMKISLLHEES